MHSHRKDKTNHTMHTNQNVTFEPLEPRLLLSADGLPRGPLDIDPANSPPAITSLSLDETVISENDSVDLSGTFDDIDIIDTHSVLINWGDGSANTVIDLTGGERSFDAMHQYLDDPGGATDIYTVSVTVTDDDGASDSGDIDVTVLNIAPDITLLSLAQAVIDENGIADLSGMFTDAGSLDSHTVTINWDDGSTDTVLDLTVGDRSFNTTHQYLDDDPTGTPSDVYTISVTVTDDDEDDSETIQITVNNVDPVIDTIVSSAAALGNASEGDEITVSGSFSDIGTLDTHTAVIDWGDGTVSNATVVQDSGSGTFSGEHVYASGGIYTVSVTVTDDDTGSDTATATAVISGIGLHDGVLQVIGTDANDRVKINQQGNGYTKVHSTFISDRGRRRTFKSDEIESVQIFLGDGNDKAQLSGNIDLETLIDGGAGNDMLKAGRGAAVLLGGDGKDKLIGGSGNDLLIGGDGPDRLVGGPGDDILIAGTTAFDIDDDNLADGFADPLLAILAEWNSGNDFATRMANLDGTTGGGLNNGFFLQPGVTVFDDGEKNKLTGSSDDNWIFDSLAAAKLQAKLAKKAAKAAKAAHKSRDLVPSLEVTDQGTIIQRGKKLGRGKKK